jgi:hypothetical protein
MPDAPGRALYWMFGTSHRNWSTPSTTLSSVVLVNVPDALVRKSRNARLDEFRFAGPLVQVLYRLASDALQYARGLRYAHGLYRLQSWMVLKHICPAYVGAACILASGGGGGGGDGGGGDGGGLGGGGLGGGLHAPSSVTVTLPTP